MKKLSAIIVIAIVCGAFFLSQCSENKTGENNNQKDSTFAKNNGGFESQVTDKDGNRYNTVHIGSQVWMSANLNASHFRNGDIIPEAEGFDGWEKAGNEGKPAWCYYDNNPVNGR